MNISADLLRPQLRLFLSVDIQDSTSFKQQADGDNPSNWKEYFLAFFREFPEALEQELVRGLALPKVWKLLGDEIVYSLEIKHPGEIVQALVSFRNAIVRHMEAAKASWKLKLKGSAWTAEFPVGNAIVPLNDGVDYIGPSMDTGFRLSRVSTPRKFAVSAELAMLILGLPRSVSVEVPLHYDGRCQLKGVMEKEGYPFLWIDLHHPKRSNLEAAEDDLLGGGPAGPAKLKRFCKQYILQHGEPRFLPFIPSRLAKLSIADQRRYKDRLREVRAAAYRLYPGLRDQEKLELSKTSARDRQLIETLNRLLS